MFGSFLGLELRRVRWDPSSGVAAWLSLHSWLSQKVVTALDRTWHPEHFFCAQCGAFFGPEGMAGLGPAHCSGRAGQKQEALWTLGPESAPKTPAPQGFMRKMAKPTAGRIISTCSLPSVVAVPGPSWRTTSQPSTPSGIPSALCAG